MDFIKQINSQQYDFLRTNKRLGNRIILMGLGGSYAYGTNNENSDIDIRGITLNTPSDLLGLTEFEQYEDRGTDTVIYSFNKMVRLLLECNPNTCEILGLDGEDYLMVSKLGQELLDHRKLFLSKRAAKSFGGYAGAQLRRLQNAIARDSMPQTEREQHILNSVRNALADFARRYESFEKGSIRLYIDRAENPQLETEIFVDAKDIQVEEGMTEAEYKALLQQRGIDKLAECRKVESFEGDGENVENFEYMKDWDLGDIVTVEYTRLGITMDERVTEVEEVFEAGVATYTPVFGSPLPEKLEFGDDTE